MGSQYYFARVADALGLYHKCPTNETMLAEMDLITPWSGLHGGIAIDGVYGYNKLILRRCTFPTPNATPHYPFLCTGSAGNPGTNGAYLGSKNYQIIYKSN